MRYPMMLVLLILTLVFIGCDLLFGTILKVALDGSQEFTSIQTAIDASAHTDTVLVYPGRFFENVRFNGKNITLASLELISGNRDYMYSTIIDAHQNGVGITCNDSESIITIRGFTVTNGTGSYNQLYDVTSGGGIVVSMMSGQKSATIINCLVTGNKADYGGGVYNGYGNLTMSGVSIVNNNATFGGGLYFGGSLTQYVSNYDPVNRCNIYSNYAARGSDLYYNEVNSVYVVVDTFTVANPWNFYAAGRPRNPSINNPYSFDILHAVHEELNSDLYVATWGDDSNSGLSPSEPMKSIFMAVYRIASDSTNPKTVHVADGVYSQTLNHQKLPIPLKSYTSLMGQSQEGVIIDAENSLMVICGSPYSQNVSVSKFTIKNCKSGIYVSNTNNLRLSDTSIQHIRGIYDAYGFSGQESFGSITLENVTILDLVSPGWATAVSIGSMEGSVDLTGLEIGSCQSSTWMPVLYLYTKGDSEVVLDRCNFHDNSNYTGDVFNTIMQIAPFDDNGTRLRVEIKDSAFFDNYQAMPSIMGMVRALNDTLFITNCTFAGNSGGSSTLAVQGTSVLTNNIFWNPALSAEVYIPNYISSDIHSHTTLNYNNIRNGMSGVVNATSQNPLIWGEGNTNYDPLFTMQGNNPYILSADSPLIDTGWQYSSGLAEPGLDAGGNERLWDGDGDGYSVIDKGAYEYQMLYAPANLNAVVSGANVWLDWVMPITERSLTGYRIYRNGVIRADINDPGLMAFRDHIAQTDTLIYAVVALYGEVESAPSNEVSVVVEVGNDDDVNIPEVDYLLVTPNPFSAFAVLRLGLVKSSDIDLGIFNLRGQKVTTISNERLDKGEHVLFWDGKDDNNQSCAEGIYILRLFVNGKQVNTRKVTYIK